MMALLARIGHRMKTYSPESENRQDIVAEMNSCHRFLYCCVNEISHILGEYNIAPLGKALECLFSTFNGLFEFSNNYFERCLLSLENVAKLSNNATMSFANISPNVSFLNISRNVSMIEEEEELPREVVREVRLRMAIKQFLKEQNLIYTSEKEFFEEKRRNELQGKFSQELEDKVIKCINSIKNEDDKYLENFFEPKVIMEVCHRVFEEMIEDSKTARIIMREQANSISEAKLSGEYSFKNIEAAFLDIKQYYEDEGLESIEFPKPAFGKELLDKSYADDTFNSAHDDIMKSFNDKNKKIALIAIEKYKKSLNLNTVSVSIQIDDGFDYISLLKKIEIDDEINRKKLDDMTQNNERIVLKIKEKMVAAEIALSQKIEQLNNSNTENVLLKAKNNQFEAILGKTEDRLKLASKELTRLKIDLETTQKDNTRQGRSIEELKEIFRTVAGSINSGKGSGTVIIKNPDVLHSVFNQLEAKLSMNNKEKATPSFNSGHFTSQLKQLKEVEFIQTRERVDSVIMLSEAVQTEAIVQMISSPRKLQNAQSNWNFLKSHAEDVLQADFGSPRTESSKPLAFTKKFQTDPIVESIIPQEKALVLHKLSKGVQADIISELPSINKGEFDKLKSVQESEKRTRISLKKVSEGVAELSSLHSSPQMNTVVVKKNKIKTSNPFTERNLKSNEKTINSDVLDSYEDFSNKVSIHQNLEENERGFNKRKQNSFLENIQRSNHVKQHKQVLTDRSIYKDKSSNRVLSKEVENQEKAKGKLNRKKNAYLFNDKMKSVQIANTNDYSSLTRNGTEFDSTIFSPRIIPGEKRIIANEQSIKNGDNELMKLGSTSVFSSTQNKPSNLPLLGRNSSSQYIKNIRNSISNADYEIEGLEELIKDYKPIGIDEGKENPHLSNHRDETILQYQKERGTRRVQNEYKIDNLERNTIPEAVLENYENLNPLNQINLEKEDYLDRLFFAFKQAQQGSTDDTSRPINIIQLVNHIGKKEYTSARALLRGELNSFVQGHQKCGVNCKHLTRFYLRLNSLLNTKKKYGRRNPVSLPQVILHESFKGESKVIVNHNKI